LTGVFMLIPVQNRQNPPRSVPRLGGIWGKLLQMCSLIGTRSRQSVSLGHRRRSRQIGQRVQDGGLIEQANVSVHSEGQRRG
jgi:hypothetical protein